MKQTELIKGHTQTIILSALNDGPKHGYIISQWVQQTSNGQLHFSAGMLYPLLHKLEKNKLITSRWYPSPNQGPKRKVYALTAKGKRALKSKTKEWEIFISTMKNILT